MDVFVSAVMVKGLFSPPPPYKLLCTFLNMNQLLTFESISESLPLPRPTPRPCDSAPSKADIQEVIAG